MASEVCKTKLIYHGIQKDLSVCVIFVKVDQESYNSEGQWGIRFKVEYNHSIYYCEN